MSALDAVTTFSGGVKTVRKFDEFSSDVVPASNFILGCSLRVINAPHPIFAPF